MIIILHEYLVFIVELPTEGNVCITLWLDLGEAGKSWYEWDCNYAAGFSALCKLTLPQAALNRTASTITGKCSK